MTNQYTQQLSAIDRRRAMLEAALGNSMRPVRGQPSAGSALGKILAAYFVRQGMDKAGDEERDITEQYAAARRNAMANILGQPDSRATLEAGLSQLDYLPPGVDPAALAAALKPNYMTLSKDQIAWNMDTGQPAAVGLASPEKPARERLVEIYDPASPTGTRMVLESEAVGRAGKMPSGFAVEVGKDGTVRMTQGRTGGEKHDKPLTEAEGKATNLGTRMRGATARMESVLEKHPGLDPSNLKDNLAMKVPVVGNYMVSPAYQQWAAAANDWVRAALRLESGAVITDEEMAGHLATFFPQPGDDEATISDKEAARRTLMEGSKAQAGRGEKVIGATSPATQTKEQILQDYQAGKLTREQAKARLNAIGVK